MKRVLILSYFFPPCNLPAAMRAYGWARHLKESGYHPIIITRHWGQPIQNTQDISKASGERVFHRIKEDFEVYYLPYQPNLRDRLFVRFGDRHFSWLRRMLSLMELLTQNFSNFLLPYKNIFRFTEIFLRRNPDIKKIVITANPFILFRWGYLLKKKFGIKWIADYRDDWNTSELTRKYRFVDRILNGIDAKSERKWVPSATTFTTVSEYYVEKIGKFLNRNGTLLQNGFSEEDFEETKQQSLFDEFTILYNGSLYPTQRIEIFLEAFTSFVQSHHDAKIKLLFPGLSFNKDQEKRVMQLTDKIKNVVLISDRVARSQLLATQHMSHALLLVAHEGLRGIPSSKLYEYIGTGKPILVCPPDGDVIERTLKPYSLAFFCRSVEEAKMNLESLYQHFVAGNYNVLKADENFRGQFSRKTQAKKLAQILDQLN